MIPDRRRTNPDGSNAKSGGSDWNCLRIKIVADRDAIRLEFIGIMRLINTSGYNATKYKGFIVLFQQ